MVPCVIMLAWIMLIGIPIYGFIRGTSMAVSLGVSLLITGLIASLLALPVSLFGSDHSATMTLSRQHFWQVVLLIPSFIAAIPLAHRLDRYLGMQFEPFDWLLGFCIGALVAFFATRFLLSSLQVAYHNTSAVSQIKRQVIVRQVVDLEAWHGLHNWATNIRGKPLEAPDE